MPPAFLLIDPVIHYIPHTAMTSSDMPKGSAASRGMNRGVKMLRIPGPCRSSDYDDHESKRVSVLSVSVNTSKSGSGENLPTVDLRSLLRDSRPSSSSEEETGRNDGAGGSSSSQPQGSVVGECPVFASPSREASKAVSDKNDTIPGTDDASLSNSSSLKASSAQCSQESLGRAGAGPQEGDNIVSVLKRKDSSRDKTRARNVSVSEPPETTPDPDPLTQNTTTASVSSTTPDNGDDSKTAADSSGTGVPGPAVVSKRRISFPADSVLTAVIQDRDTAELIRILTGRHGPGLVQREDGTGGVDVRQTNHVGLTALHHAVLADNLDAAKLLLCHGADVNAQDVHGFSPLHTAAACGFLPLTSLLLLFGADVFAQTRDRELPIDVAKELRVVRVLSSEMTRLVQRELWMTSAIRARAEELWLLARKLLACVLLLVLHVCVCVRTGWRRHRKAE